MQFIYNVIHNKVNLHRYIWMFSKMGVHINHFKRKETLVQDIEIHYAIKKSLLLLFALYKRPFRKYIGYPHIGKICWILKKVSLFMKIYIRKYILKYLIKVFYVFWWHKVFILILTFCLLYTSFNFVIDLFSKHIENVSITIFPCGKKKRLIALRILTMV